jgi:hypothetical protein
MVHCNFLHFSSLSLNSCVSDSDSLELLSHIWMSICRAHRRGAPMFGRLSPHAADRNEEKIAVASGRGGGLSSVGRPSVACRRRRRRCRRRRRRCRRRRRVVVVSCRCRVVSCRVVSRRVVVVSCRVVSRRVVSRRVVSCRVVSCRVVSCRGRHRLRRRRRPCPASVVVHRRCPFLRCPFVGGRNPNFPHRAPESFSFFRKINTAPPFPP